MKSPFEVEDTLELLLDLLPPIVESEDELLELDPNILNKPNPPEPPDPALPSPELPPPDGSGWLSGGGCISMGAKRFIMMPRPSMMAKITPPTMA